MREFDAYLFDADGTIIDTRELIYQGYKHVLETMGTPPRTREHIESKTGLPIRTHICELVGYDRGEDFYVKAMDIFEEFNQGHYDTLVKPFPGVKEGLAKLAGMGKKLAVVTSRPRDSLLIITNALELTNLFAVLVTPEDTEKHKPDPAPALLAMDALKADPAHTVFVGDAEFDMRCGNSAGIATAYIAWSGMDISQWPVRPDFIARDFKDILPDE